MPRVLANHDPYDLTGAHRTYLELVADGVPEHEAVALARLTVHRFAPSVLDSLTSGLRPYMEWCRETGHAPFPAARTTVARFLEQMAHRGHPYNGTRLSSTAAGSFRHAMHYAHVFAGHGDPFVTHPDLAPGRQLRQALLATGRDPVNRRPPPREACRSVAGHAVRAPVATHIADPDLGT